MVTTKFLSCMAYAYKYDNSLVSSFLKRVCFLCCPATNIVSAISGPKLSWFCHLHLSTFEIRHHLRKLWYYYSSWSSWQGNSQDFSTYCFRTTCLWMLQCLIFFFFLQKKKNCNSTKLCFYFLNFWGILICFMFVLSIYFLFTWVHSLWHFLIN